jgi:hypothetical protein
MRGRRHVAAHVWWYAHTDWQAVRRWSHGWLAVHRASGREGRVISSIAGLTLRRHTAHRGTSSVRRGLEGERHRGRTAIIGILRRCTIF